MDEWSDAAPPDELALVENDKKTVADVIRRMFFVAGLSPEAIAVALSIPVSRVKLVIKHASHAYQSPGTEELTDLVGVLVQKAIQNAMQVLEFGPPSDKMRITIAMLSGINRTLGKNEGEGVDDIRAAFQKMLQDQRTVTEKQTVLTDEGFVDVPTTGVLTQPAFDQD